MDTAALSQKQQMLLDTVRKLVRQGANANLDRMVDKLHPVEIAALFPHLNDWEARNLLSMLLEHDLSFGSEVLSEMEESIATPLLEQLPKERISQVISEVPADDGANLLRMLPEEAAMEIVPTLEDDVSEAVEEVLAYPSDSAGGLMNTEPFALHDTNTIGEAITSLQQASESLEMVFYVYITNSADQLVGVLSLRSLLTRSPETPLKELMITEVLSVHTSTSQKDVAKMVARYNLLAVPVVDDFNKLVGIVTVDDVIDVLQEEANEDILKMVGAGEEEVGERSTLRSVRTRAPWMLGTLAAGLLGSEVIHRHHPTLEATIVLAGFIPVMVGLSGNAGNQSAALTARGILQAQGDGRMLWRYLFRELRVGALLGVASGLLVALFIGLRYETSPMLPVAVGLSAFLSIVTAVTLGTLSPLLLNRLKLDPSFATGPFVSTVVDVLGIALYFTLTTRLLS